MDHRLDPGDRIALLVPGSTAYVDLVLALLRPTTMFCVRAHLQRLFAHWDEVGTPDLSSIRLLAHAGAPCPDVLKQRLIEAFPDGSTWEF